MHLNITVDHKTSHDNMCIRSYITSVHQHVTTHSTALTLLTEFYRQYISLYSNIVDCTHIHVYIHMHTCVSRYIYICIVACMHVSSRASPVGVCCICVRALSHTYIHTYIHACMHTCIHAYMHTYMHLYIYIFIPTYLPTYTHQSMYTYIHYMLLVSTDVI